MSQANSLAELAALEDGDAEVSWFFNDINLTMVCIVLFLAIVFAVMIADSQQQAQGTNPDVETISREEKRPTELSSAAYYGDTGFPQAEMDKGFPTKDTFNEDLIITRGKTIRLGMGGNLVWDFEQMDNIRERKTLRVLADEAGNLRYMDEEIMVEELQGLIDTAAVKHNVFVELYLSPQTPVAVYEQLRDALWNDSAAVHWQFITDTAQYQTALPSTHPLFAPERQTVVEDGNEIVIFE